uniref:Uncharacterized protein n=1 Tax=Arundo donax TaxID=35708 RepID=A0A0A9GIP2_ARUDO
MRKELNGLRAGLGGRRRRRAVRVQGGGGWRRPGRRSRPHSSGSSGPRRSGSMARVRTPTDLAESERDRGGGSDASP